MLEAGGARLEVSPRDSEMFGDPVERAERVRMTVERTNSASFKLTSERIWFQEPFIVAVKWGQVVQEWSAPVLLGSSPLDVA